MTCMQAQEGRCQAHKQHHHGKHAVLGRCAHRAACALAKQTLPACQPGEGAKSCRVRPSPPSCAPPPQSKAHPEPSASPKNAATTRCCCRLRPRHRDGRKPGHLTCPAAAAVRGDGGSAPVRISLLKAICRDDSGVLQAGGCRETGPSCGRGVGLLRGTGSWRTPERAKECRAACLWETGPPLLCCVFGVSQCLCLRLTVRPKRRH